MYWIDDGWDVSLWLTLILKGKRPFDRGGEMVWEINARSTPQVDRLWRSRESSEAGHPRLPTATVLPKRVAADLGCYLQASQESF